MRISKLYKSGSFDSLPSIFGRLVLIVFLFVICATSVSAQEPFRIMICDDDGIDSEGIYALAMELSKIATITVVAPQENRSGAGHSITTEGPIIVKDIYREGKFFGYGVNGTPATCVKLGISQLLDKKPDLVVSGINEGFNLGWTSYVSGTFGAAQEAVLQGVPGIAVSLERGKNMDYTVSAEFVRVLVEQLRVFGFPRDTVMNVNVPLCPRDKIRGVALTVPSDFQYKEIWTKRKTPWGQRYFWSTVRKPVKFPDPGTDHWAVEENMISVTPVPIMLKMEDARQFLSRFSISFDGKKSGNFLGSH